MPRTVSDQVRTRNGGRVAIRGRLDSWGPKAIPRAVLSVCLYALMSSVHLCTFQCCSLPTAPQRPGSLVGPGRFRVLDTEQRSWGTPRPPSSRGSDDLVSLSYRTGSMFQTQNGGCGSCSTAAATRRDLTGPSRGTSSVRPDQRVRDVLFDTAWTQNGGRVR
jgi:hypothetical protein